MLAHGFGGSKADVVDRSAQARRHGYVALAWTRRAGSGAAAAGSTSTPRTSRSPTRASSSTRSRPCRSRARTAPATRGSASRAARTAVRWRSCSPGSTDGWTRSPRRSPGTTCGRRSSRSSGRRRELPRPRPPRWPRRAGRGVQAGLGRGLLRLGVAATAAGAPGGSTAAAAPDAGATPARARRRRRDRATAQPPALAADACGRFAADLCGLYAEAARPVARRRRCSTCSRRSSPARVAEDVTAPTLLVQGQADSLFPLSEGDANAKAIAANGTPVKVVWEAGGHDGGARRVAAAARPHAHLVRPLREEGRLGARTPGSRSPCRTPSCRASTATPRRRSGSRAAEPGVTAPGRCPSSGCRSRGAPQVVHAPPGGSPAAAHGAARGRRRARRRARLGRRRLRAVGAARPGRGVPDRPPRAGRHRRRRRPRSRSRSRRRPRTRRSSSGSTTSRPPVRRRCRAGSSRRCRLELAVPGRAGRPAPARSTRRRHGRPCRPSSPTSPVGHRLRVVVSTTDQGYALPADGRGLRDRARRRRTLTVPVLDAVVVGGGLRPLLPGPSRCSG